MTANIKQIQDAAEYYAIYRLQAEAEKIGCASNTLSLAYEQVFLDYLKSCNITFSEFMDEGPYYTNINNNVSNVVTGWNKTFKDLTFDFKDTIITGRAAKIKADFTIELSNGRSIGVSLKNYKGDKIDKIQVCSGTFASAILNILFESSAVGVWEYNGVTFTAKPNNKDKCQNAISVWLNKNNIISTSIINCYEQAVKINEDIKAKYVTGDFAEILTPLVAKSWKKDCVDFGNTQIDNMLLALKDIPESYIKHRFLKMTGLDASEELLCLIEGKFLDSITNTKFKNLTTRVNNSTMKVLVKRHKKSIRFSAVDDHGIIVNVDVPFTFNKNGAWHNKSTGRICSKSKEWIEPYHRRPAKAKELNSSTNTYICLGEALK